MIRELKFPNPNIDVDNLTLIKELLEMGYKNKYHNDCEIVIKYNEENEPCLGELIFHNPDETAKALLWELHRRGCPGMQSGENDTMTLSPEFIKIILDNKWKLQLCGSSSSIDRLAEQIEEIYEALRKLPPITLSIADLLSRVKKIENELEEDKDQ